MARSGEVRDAVVAELKKAFPDETVESFVVPNHTREELEKGRRVLVRFATRNIELEQGPDSREVVLNIGVTGIGPSRTASGVDYRTEEVIAVDKLEGLMESIIELWLVDGPLARCPMAEHSFTDIDQTFQFDADRFYNHGIYLTMIQVTYRDSRDD